MSGKNWDRVPIDAQSVDAPLSQSAIFLVVTVAAHRHDLLRPDPPHAADACAGEVR